MPHMLRCCRRAAVGASRYALAQNQGHLAWEVGQGLLAQCADPACETIADNQRYFNQMPHNKPLEWTGHHLFHPGVLESLPATQGQR